MAQTMAAAHAAATITTAAATTAAATITAADAAKYPLYLSKVPP